MAVAAAPLLASCSQGDEADAATQDDRTNPLGYEDGVAPVDGLSFLEGLGLYVLAPLTILVVIFALVWLPGVVRSSRYRPGRGWTAAPLWFGGPPDPVSAVESAETGDVVRGGASGDW
jgi:hypothetical protein